MRVLALLLTLFLAAAASAQSQSQQVPRATAEQNVNDQQQRAVTQPGNNAPFYREVRSGNAEYTTSSVKGPEAGVLIQSRGETWRQIRNGPAMFYGGWLLVLVIAAILGLYLWKGPVKLSEPLTGRRMRRFTPFEMTVHWSTAISFCLLGLSGLVMFFGKSLLLPLIGYTLFGWLTYLCKNVHNFIAPLFIVSAAVMVLIWARDNILRRYDWQWFRRAWAFFLKSEHIPSGRFNAGEKAWFWGGVLLLSVVMTWSGLVLLFPNFDQTRATLQAAWIWHVAAAMLYIAASLGHIYMGTIGVAHTYDNMRHGWTDETWAKEHHSIWYDEVKSGRRAAHEGESMRTILATLAGGLLIGAVAASYAKLPPPTPEEKAAAAAKAQKAESEKAKAAQEVSRAQDKAVANYKKNKGKHSSSAGATAHGQSQGADHSNSGLPDSELTPHEAQTEMPKPGQVNDYSTPKRDPQNSSGSR